MTKKDDKKKYITVRIEKELHKNITVKKIISSESMNDVLKRLLKENNQTP